MAEIIELAKYRNRVKTQLKDDDFGERLKRIRSSLDKINRLMQTLKEMNEESRN